MEKSHLLFGTLQVENIVLHNWEGEKEEREWETVCGWERVGVSVIGQILLSLEGSNPAAASSIVWKNIRCDEDDRENGDVDDDGNPLGGQPDDQVSMLKNLLYRLVHKY